MKAVAAKAVIAGLAIIAATAGAETTVYRSLDAAGHAVFSDRPVPGTQPLSLRRSNTYAAREVPMPGLERTALPAANGRSRSYESLEIVSPAPGATVRANGGEVRVLGRVVPELRSGHRPVLAFDGERIPCSEDGQGGFACVLAGVARGPHEARVEVVDGDGAVAMRGSATRFHVLRASVGSRGR